jgi:predicted nucleic acid-binding protein
MGVNYLWDTNTAIYYLQQLFPTHAEKLIDDLIQSEQPVISAITEIELLCWKTATEKDLEVLNGFIEDSLVIELEQAIKIKTANIRKSHKIKLPDAIIAATALVYDLTLISRNTSDFIHIDGIKLLDPFKESRKN